ncbi:MAG: hypothetical protein ACR2RL_17115, partial [Gammaproteobacteria bacterium]
RSVAPEGVGKMLESAGFRIVERYGSQVRWPKLEQALRPEHRAIVGDLLKVHPHELVAAMIGPLYPDAADQVTFHAVT